MVAEFEIRCGLVVSWPACAGIVGLSLTCYGAFERLHSEGESADVRIGMAAPPARAFVCM